MKRRLTAVVLFALWPRAVLAQSVKVSADVPVMTAPALPSGLPSVSPTLLSPVPALSALGVAPLSAAPLAAPSALAASAAAAPARAAAPAAAASPAAAAAASASPAAALAPAAAASAEDAPGVRAQLGAGARESGKAAAALSAGGGDVAGAVGLGRRQFDAARAAGSADGVVVPPGAPPGGGRGGSGGGGGDFAAALRRLGVPAATVAALEAAAAPQGRPLAALAAAAASERGGELTRDEEVGLIAAALLRGASGRAAAPALALLAETHAGAAALARAIEQPLGGTVEPLTSAQRGWALTWSARLGYFADVAAAGSDAARLRPLMRSIHFSELPAAVRDDVGEAVSSRDRPRVESGAARGAEARGPPETVEAVLARAVASGEMDAARAAEWTKVVYRDGLMGLRNRVDLDEHLPELVARSRSLIVFKLDFLKEINDTFGHEVGNEALKKLAAIAARGVPEEDLFRRSPTGFAILTDAGPDEARRLAESDARLMAEALRGLVDQKIGASEKALGRRVQGVDWGGTISVGVSVFDHQGTAEQSYDRALARAEDARIFAKDIGLGNRVAVSDEGLRLMERRELAETIDALSGTRPRTAAALSAAAARTLEDLEAEHRALGRLGEPVPRMLARLSDGALKERLFAAVYLDRLTGLRNRRWLFDHLPELFAPGATRSYIALDIDKFGVLNAKVGEQKADLVLQDLGGVLEDAVKGRDATVLHLSGEEFVVLAGPGVADAAALAETVRETVQAELGRRAARRGVVDRDTGAPLTVTVSVGVAAVPQSGDGPEPILTLATAMSESMLQRAKARGRNQVVVDGAPITASELMSRLSRLIRIDDSIRAVVASVIAPSKPSETPTSFDNSYKTKAQVLKILGFNPFWRAARSEATDRLADRRRGGLVARVRGEGGQSYVVKVAAEPAAQNELLLRGLLDAFELFNESLAAPRAVAYRELLGPPIVVMPDVPNRHPHMDGRHLPLEQQAALAAFSLTFGVTPDPDAFLDVDWTRTTLADFARARQETRPGATDRRRWDAPWVSEFYVNDIADYRPALARWSEAFARPSAQAEIAAQLRRAGVPEARVAAELELFRRNHERLEEALKADIARANRDFYRAAGWAELDDRQTRALSDVNHSAQSSALGGAMRDVLRWLNGGARPDMPFHVEPDEMKMLAAAADPFSRAARLRLAREADRGFVHRRDGERLSERQALEAFDSLALRVRGAAAGP